MPALLGVIADDYTGGSDLASTLKMAGLRTLQTIGIPDPDLRLPEADTIIVALKIRSVDPAEAVAAAAKAGHWLKAQGAMHVMYKVCSTFDSTDAGNIGPVTDTLHAQFGIGPALVTPSFPSAGRTVYKGHLFVADRLLSESSMRDHPINPMHDSDLVRVLQRQSRNSVGLLDHAAITSGTDEINRKLRSLAEQAQHLIVADAIYNSDLEVLGALALEFGVSTGASGLGFGLARALIDRGYIKESNAADDMDIPVGGPSAVIAGSCSTATLRQIEMAERKMPVLRLDPELLLQDAEQVDAAVAWAGERIDASPVVIVASADAEAVQRLQARHGRDNSGRAIEAATSAIASRLVERGVRKLVVAGGETSGAIVDSLGIKAFMIGDEIQPGVPLLRALGGRYGDMMLALKSGNFGQDDFFEVALDRMRSSTVHVQLSNGEQR